MAHGQRVRVAVLVASVAGARAWCEAMVRSKMSGAYGSSPGLSEPVNAATSLAFSCFGLSGLATKHQSSLYYLVMHLFVLTGGGSFTHHLLYSDADWAYIWDIVALLGLGGVAFYYMVTGPSCRHRLLELVASTNVIGALVLYAGGDGVWRHLIVGTTGGIVLAQGTLVVHLWMDPTARRWRLRIMMAAVWHAVLAGAAMALWQLDAICPVWIRGHFNAHSAWHVLIAWALFGSVQLTALYATHRRGAWRWIALCDALPWILFVVHPLPSCSATTMDKETSTLLVDERAPKHRRAHSAA